MSEIKFPPITEILRRRLQADSQPSLSDQIVPVIVLEGPQPEYAFVEGGPIYSTVHRIEQTPGAGNFVHFQLHNPANSGMLAVIERIGLVHSCGAAVFGPSEYRVQRHDTPLASLHLVGGMRDARWDSTGFTGNRRAACQLRTTVAGAAAGLDIGRMVNSFGAQLASSVQYGAEWHWPLVLCPGSGYLVVSNGQTANRNDYQATFVFRERPMSAWERQAIPGG